MDEIKIFRDEIYKLVGKNYHPEENEILYRFDDCLEIEPLGVEITKWGANNHNEDNNFLIEGKNIYPQEVLDEWKKKYGNRKFKKMMKNNPKTSWYYLPELYRKFNVL